MGKSLVIVESPAKARTIGRFLGDDFIVAPSIGHVRDLPGNAADVPARYKGLGWARLGVNVDDGFEPLYVIPAHKKEQVRKLKALLKGAEAVYLATDEDREGESISWHLLQVLKPKVPVHRLVFHEITRSAIDNALDNPRDVDESLVRAQETRRILDRLFGYEVSPLLWRKIRPKLSAGRVQSVAVRLVVERERLRIAFHSADYWAVRARFSVTGGSFKAQLAALDGRSIAARPDFDPDTGKLKARSRKLHLQRDRATQVVEDLTGATGQVVEADERPFKERPAAPFITSTLQQEANRKLRWTARRSMKVAQRLYENGWITYMRTDSATLSREALSAARGLIAKEYGPDFLPAAPRAYRSRSRIAQEAHEAIRPAGSQFRSLREARGALDDEEYRLYDLIFRRTVASQMVDARGTRLRLGVKVDDALFVAQGKTIQFPGYRRAYVEGTDDNGQAQDDSANVLPPVKLNEPAQVTELLPREHHTQPPPRLTEATLVKELEARGIGRPSTYASIIDTIQQRGYVFKRGNALVPTFTAFSVTDLLAATLSDLVDYTFTARMEDELDQIALGRLDQQQYLHAFFLGQGGGGLRDRTQQALESVDPRAICTIPIDDGDERVCLVRVGRYGAYLEEGEHRVDLPDDLPPDELDAERARAMLAEEARWPRELGPHPDCGKQVLVLNGPYGPYVQLGLPEESPKTKGKKKPPKPKRSSLLKGMDPHAIDLATAVQLLSLPRVLGDHPESGEPVQAANGRYGPYIRSGSETRSLPNPAQLLTITLEEALVLLAAPRRRRGRSSTPARELGTHPDSGARILLRSGRYGPYVTDGSVNASLPKGTEADGFSLEAAVALLAEKASKPARKRAPRRRKKRS